MFLPKSSLTGARRLTRRLLAIVAMLTVFVAGAPMAPAALAQSAPSAHDVNAQLGVGVNLGNALEGPREGDWGMTIEAGFFPLIAAAGFGHVRVPIKFSAYADAAAPFTIPNFDASVRNANSLWARIDWVIAQAEANDLYVIIDLHHYDEIHGDVAGHRDRFLAIWNQIATRYQSASSKVLFELLNEPNGQFSADPALLNDLIADGLDVIRGTNPDRPVLVGPAQYNSIFRLDDLQLPADDNLIVSVHYYEPFDFTHQGAEWLANPPAAPAGWDADTVGFGAGWQNWSWDTAVTPAAGWLTVDYSRQWAGLQFARPDLPLDPATMQVEIAGQSQLTVRCGSSAGTIEVTRIDTLAGGSTHQVDMSACPSDSTLIAFQLASTTLNPLRYRSAELCDANGECSQLVQSATDVVVANFDDAQAWAAANDRPINIGEFGAYSAGGVAALSDRAEWTAVVRNAAIDRNMSVSYWEFGAGFGVYDRQASAWVQPLLTALDPGSVAPPPPPPPPPAIGDPAATTFTDGDAQVGAKYQVHYQGLPRVECSIVAEPSVGGPGPVVARLVIRRRRRLPMVILRSGRSIRFITRVFPESIVRSSASPAVPAACRTRPRTSN